MRNKLSVDKIDVVDLVQYSVPPFSVKRQTVSVDEDVVRRNVSVDTTEAQIVHEREIAIGDEPDVVDHIRHLQLLLLLLPHVVLLPTDTIIILEIIIILY